MLIFSQFYLPTKFISGLPGNSRAWSKHGGSLLKTPSEESKPEFGGRDRGREDSVQAVQGLKPELGQHWGTHSAVPGPRVVPDGCGTPRPQMRHRASDVPPEWKATEESKWSHCSAHSPASGQQERVVPGEEGRVLCESIKQQRGG